jgi:hypothetical protein
MSDTVPATKAISQIVDGVSAPIVYFYEVLSQGFVNGIANIPIVVFRYRADEAGMFNREVMVVAELRCNFPGLVALKNAVDAVLLIAQKPAEEATRN